uniref:SCP domain-containing protein n=1 Tax=Ascaris lumbricoides TaxID=6252 RepID=A0A0M3I313_ASCLU
MKSTCLGCECNLLTTWRQPAGCAYSLTIEERLERTHEGRHRSIGVGDKGRGIAGGSPLATIDRFALSAWHERLKLAHWGNEDRGRSQPSAPTRRAKSANTASITACTNARA